ncbi:MAG TPA: alpha/beta hydrolase, partial [Alcanivorax sp.]|nr:alpha/beta hydrolase [Alcanivorax sp.]
MLIEGLGPPATAADEVAPNLRKAIDQMQALPDKRKPVYADPEQAVAARLPALGGLEESSARLLCERGLEQVDGGWTWRTDARLRITSSLRLTDDQVKGFVERITAPTLLVLGNEGLGGDGRFDHRIEWLRDVRVTRLPGRHHLHMDDPLP